ncbi:hypothetical protein COLO4_28298 [Corchorus olitorius]|uniref:DUF7780 domain-containing protein n=1 Tax=Corchorus olitorius TaxID=93759 RepID=A0A1R3HM72_9ROSI|nr:hypothetical protein COLO4_28298 [Corchorus olitorius]
MGFQASAAAPPAIANPNTHSTTTKGNRGAMGLLLIFFPEDQNKINPSTRFIRRTSSSLLFNKAQSTISICALLVFLTLLVFTLSTFEPSIPTPTTSQTSTVKTSRRFLSQNSHLSSSSSSSDSHWFFPMWDYKPLHVKQKSNVSSSSSSFALQGMGTLYRRGSKAMNDLIVSHVVEDVNEDELRLFLRVLHRSGVTSKADTVFIFGSSLLSSRFGPVIQEENESFFKLVQHYKEMNNKDFPDSVFRFDPTQFWKSGKKDVAEPIWGKRSRGNYSNNPTEAEGESTRLTYGSIVGFDVNELDPENSLAGFLDHVPMRLRRWACYPMLLGRVRRNFKHMMLLDVKKLMLLSDPLGRVRNRSPESVLLLTKESSSGKHGKKNSEKTHLQVNSAILMGGAKGIRRLANAMLTEIVRATMQHKKKNSISESGILSQLVGNEHILKNVNLITSTESIQEASSLMGLSSHSTAGYTIIQRGNSNNHDLNSIIMKLICLSEVDSSVYRDC